MIEETDVAIIGAGPAGLQAALTLGRMHRRVVVFDSSRYRNDPASAMHNLIGHDGQPPAELRAAARAELNRYETVTLVEASVSQLAGEKGEFALSTSVGEVTASRVVLATGMRDSLPEIPGLESVFGGAVAHCPFCHGHEFAGTPVALIGPGPFLEHMSAMMSPIASSLTAMTDGAPLDAAIADRLDLMGVTVTEIPVHGVRQRGDGVDVILDDGQAAHGRDGHGSLTHFGGALVKLDSEPAAPHAAQLGVEISEIGAVYVDHFGRTSVDGVYAAGDIAQQRGTPGPVWAVWSAIATGGAAGTGAVQDLAAEDLSRLPERQSSPAA